MPSKEVDLLLGQQNVCSLLLLFLSELFEVIKEPKVLVYSRRKIAPKSVRTLGHVPHSPVISQIRRQAVEVSWSEPQHLQLSLQRNEAATCHSWALNGFLTESGIVGVIVAIH